MFTFTNTAATTAAVANRIVTSTNMANGTYTIANASPVWAGGALITVTHTAVTGTDTLGTITVVGKDLAGQTITEVITPLDGTVATGTKVFRSVTSATQAGWVINTGNDTIVMGVAAGNIVAVGPGKIQGVLLANSVAATVTLADGARTIMVIPASQAAGTFYNLGGVDFTGNLKITTTNTNDVTVFHTPSLPSTYAF